MTAKYFAILTNQGAARLANAAALGTKLNLTQMAVGDAMVRCRLLTRRRRSSLARSASHR